MARRRRKNNHMDTKQAGVVTNKTTEEGNDVSVADKALNDAKGKFQAVMVIGVDQDNQIDISTSHPNYSTLQYWLNRASFELLVHEKSSMAKKEGE